MRWLADGQPQVGGLADIACASATTCIAVGNTNSAQFPPAIARTTDGGATWGAVGAPGAISIINFVTCQSPSFCLIGGAGPGASCCSSSMSSVSHDAGATWSTAAVAGGPAGLIDSSCSDELHCVGLIGSGGTNTAGLGRPVVSSDGGNTWAGISTTVGQSVSCSHSFCVSVGGKWQPPGDSYPGDAFLSTDGGSQWSQMTLTTPDILSAVSCPSSTTCVAVGGNFDGTEGLIMSYGS